VPYELIRRSGERAVAEGKATLASIKIATDSQSYFAQSLFIPCLRAEIVKPQRQKPCETQRAPVGRAGSSAPFQAPRRAILSGGAKYMPLRLLAAILNFLAVAPAQRHRGSANSPVPVHIAATIDMMAAALAAGQ
jgi:hypothetical protein